MYGKDTHKILYNLTETEIEYLKLIPEELTYQEIAFRLGRSETTVKKTYSNLKDKLGVKTLQGLAIKARDLDII